MEAPGPETVLPPPPVAWMRLAIAFYGGMAALAWLWREAWQGQQLLYASSEAARGGVSWATDISLGLAAGVAFVALSRWLTRHTSAGERLARRLAGALGKLELRHCLALALASALGEEALFRGALQPSLGLLGASLVFGGVHFAPRRDLWPWSVFAFVGGLGLGSLFDATGNLVAPIVAHATLNALNLTLLVREYGEQARP
jgi:membrane protease YdiL (CAAX protease family)